MIIMPYEHVEPITILEHHKAECYSDHCHIGEFVAEHTGYVEAHSHSDLEHHKPDQPAPNGYHWAFNPGHWDEWYGDHGHNFHDPEWVLHHNH